MTNNYRPGTLAWIERNNYLQARAILLDLLADAITAEEAKSELYALESDSASF